MGVLPFLGSPGPTEMAVDVLNLFLIKGKAPACVRDELLKRSWEEETERKKLRHGQVGSVFTAPTATNRLPASAGLRSPSLPASPARSGWRVSLLLTPAPWEGFSGSRPAE